MPSESVLVTTARIVPGWSSEVSIDALPEGSQTPMELARKPLVLKSVDYGSILLIVYAAFSQGVVNGLWHQVDAAQLVRLTLVDAALLAAVITILTFANRRLGFSRADEITIVFCGSKKSLANGVPIATLLFAGHVGLVILPVMVFQQIQLMVCASLARRYAARRTAPDSLAVLPSVATSVKVT